VPHAPEFSLEAVRWLAWATLTLVLLLVLGLMHLRWVRWRSEPQKSAFRQRWSEVLMRCALGEELNGQMPSLKPRERWPFLKLWLHCQLSIKGPGRERLAELAHSLDCSAVAMSKLNSRHSAERLMATLALGFLRDEQAQQALLRLLDGVNQTAALHAARALLEIDPNSHSQKVTEALLFRKNLDLPLTSVLLKPFANALSPTMSCMVPAMPEMSASSATQNQEPNGQVSALQWLRLARALSLQVPSERLRSFLTDDQDIDVLIAAIRLIQGEQGNAALAALAQHADWRVRAQVAQAIGRLGQLRDVDLLIHMTTDPQWWVRYRATQAVLRIPGLAQDQAKSLIQQTGDRFAVNMFESVISERGAVA
jgi:HEAT repeat protein